MSGDVCDNPKVMRGLERQLERRSAALATGERRLGWKTGMGSEALMTSLGTSGALVGYLTDATLLPSGAVVDVAGWVQPMVEPEIAIRMGTELPGGAGSERAAAAIEAIAAAIEVADTDLPFEDPEALLAGNLFHRGVILGPFDSGRAGAEVGGISLDVDAGGRRHTEGADPLAIVGDLAEVARHVADVLARAGERLEAGDVVITGSAIPPLTLAPGERIDVHYRNLGAVSIEAAGPTDQGDPSADA